MRETVGKAAAPHQEQAARPAKSPKPLPKQGLGPEPELQQDDSQPSLSHDFGRISVRSTTPRATPTGLAVKASEDDYEQAAFRMAGALTPDAQPATTSRENSSASATGQAETSEHSGGGATAGQPPTSGPASLPIASPLIQDALNSSEQPLDHEIRALMEQHFKHDFSRVRVHADERAALSAVAVGARAYTVGQNIVFGAGQYAPSTEVGQRLLAHELTHVVQQHQGHRPTMPQRQIQPEDVSGQMVGQQFIVTGAFMAGRVRLLGGEFVEVVAWDNALTTARVRLPQQPGTVPTRAHFDIPKSLLRPIVPSGTGLAPYSAGVSQQARSVEEGERDIAALEARRSQYRTPRARALFNADLSSRQGLQRNRNAELNRRLIQETMYNRFDPLIRRWVDYYTARYPQLRPPLDANAVKAMLFQESEMGTSGTYMFIPPPADQIRTQFNIGQAIDSAGNHQLIMMEEIEPNLITTYHLENIRRDLIASQNEFTRLRARPTLTPTERARLSELTLLSQPGGNWQHFFWEYRAAGQSTGFREAVTAFFNSPTASGGTARNLDYEFWIRTAIRWLFHQRLSGMVNDWPEAIRAYNGSGQVARDYRDAVRLRRDEAIAAERARQPYVPHR